MGYFSLDSNGVGVWGNSELVSTSPLPVSGQIKFNFVKFKNYVVIQNKNVLLSGKYLSGELSSGVCLIKFVYASFMHPRFILKVVPKSLTKFKSVWISNIVRNRNGPLC